ncbi:MAG TPA: outer membrane beta-barrel protein [Pyrinomonadaceae bacterium]|nr:outer membrane beta-barrel protein [Pyrinomonadaceae bacterium]
MLRKTFVSICLLILASFSAQAQGVPKAEVFGGYSWSGGNFHGWNSSVTGNITRKFGIVADTSAAYGTELDGAIRIQQTAYSLLVGPRFSFRPGKRATPFVYALVGVTRFEARATISGQSVSESDSGFSSALGVGLDVKVNDRVAIRAFQLDYFRPNFFGEAHNRGRLAFGVVLRFGEK